MAEKLFQLWELLIEKLLLTSREGLDGFEEEEGDFMEKAMCN